MRLAHEDETRFDSALSLFKDTVEKSTLPRDDKAALLRQGSHSLSLRMFKAWIRRDAPAAENALTSKRYDEQLRVDDKQDLLESIRRDREVRELQASIDQSQAVSKFNSDVSARHAKSVNDAEAGVYAPVPFADLERVFGTKAAREMQADLASTADTAVDLLKVKTQSLPDGEEDAPRIRGRNRGNGSSRGKQPSRRRGILLCIEIRRQSIATVGREET